MASNPCPVEIWHVAFPVGDLDRSVAFYCGALGFELVTRDAESAFVCLGKMGFTLEFLAADTPSRALPDHLAFAADDLTALRKKLVAGGFAPTEISKIGSRAARMALSDPDGLRIDLFEARDEIEAWMTAEAATAAARPEALP